MTQLHVMNMLERHGEVAMSRLAEMLDVSDSNATGLIDRIEERGFVERIRVPSDRRVVLVRITDRGREVMEEVEMLREEMLERMLGRLDEPNLMRVAAAMSDLREAIVTTVADPNSGVSHTHEPQGRD
jgi:DNA-binding MarR family transcriptional regulator